MPCATPPPTLTDLRSRGAAVFRELATFGEPPATQTVALSPVKDLLAVAGADGAIRLWDLHSRAKAATLRTGMHQRTGHDALALSLAFSPDGALLASGHVDGNVHLWDMATDEEVPVRMRHEGVGGRARLLAGRLDAGFGLDGLEPAPVGRGRRLSRARRSACWSASPRGSPP